MVQESIMREAIEKVTKKTDLAEAYTRKVFEEIMSGKAAPEEIASFLKALREKGETVEEITGAAKVLIEKSARIDAGRDLVDTCGTGGSGINTFNISTTAAFVAAGCGVKVAKHGNRSASGQCGSADLLEALGARVEVPAQKVSRMILEIGIGFMYAPVFHGAMKYAAGPRKAIGGRTIFNILGPLSNPAGAKSQVVGVYDRSFTEKMADVLKSLGSKRVLVVCGSDNLDEITITGQTKVTELKDGVIKTYQISPEEFGIKKAGLSDIMGGSAQENAKITLSILKGESSSRTDIVLMNAAAALIVASKAGNFKEGIKAAKNSIDSGEAFGKLEQFIKLTNSP